MSKVQELKIIDSAERRTWFLFEASRGPDPSGH
jgi:hypothetical protein